MDIIDYRKPYICPLKYIVFVCFNYQKVCTGRGGGVHPAKHTKYTLFIYMVNHFN
jgi:hypothetical protein